MAGGTTEAIRWSEATAFPLIAEFKQMHPDGGATDRELMAFMGAGSPEAARHWRLRYEKKEQQGHAISG